MLSESEHSVATAAAVNGASAEGGAAVLNPQADLIPRTGPRIPRIESELNLPGYDGMTITVWINPPKRLGNEFTSSDTERTMAALREIVVAHNGWLDEDDQPLPPPTTQAFWDAIPTHLAIVILRTIGELFVSLPNFPTPAPRR